MESAVREFLHAVSRFLTSTLAEVSRGKPTSITSGAVGSSLDDAKLEVRLKQLAAQLQVLLKRFPTLRFPDDDPSDELYDDTILPSEETYDDTILPPEETYDDTPAVVADDVYDDTTHDVEPQRVDSYVDMGGKLPPKPAIYQNRGGPESSQLMPPPLPDRPPAPPLITEETYESLDPAPDGADVSLPTAAGDRDEKDSNSTSTVDPEGVSLVSEESADVEPLSAVQARQLAARWGRLELRQNSKLRPYRRYWGALCAGRLYLYSRETDTAHKQSVNLCGYEPRRPPTSADLKEKHRPTCFELVRPGGRTHQFLALTAKDAKQWIAALERAIAAAPASAQTSGTEPSGPGQAASGTQKLRLLPPSVQPPAGASQTGGGVASCPLLAPRIPAPLPPNLPPALLPQEASNVPGKSSAGDNPTLRKPPAPASGPPTEIYDQVDEDIYDDVPDAQIPDHPRPISEDIYESLEEMNTAPPTVPPPPPPVTSGDSRSEAAPPVPARLPPGHRPGPVSAGRVPGPPPPRPTVGPKTTPPRSTPPPPSNAKPYKSAAPPPVPERQGVTAPSEPQAAVTHPAPAGGSEEIYDDTGDPSFSSGADDVFHTSQVGEYPFYNVLEPETEETPVLSVDTLKSNSDRDDPLDEGYGNSSGGSEAEGRVILESHYKAPGQLRPVVTSITVGKEKPGGTGQKFTSVTRIAAQDTVDKPSRGKSEDVKRLSNSEDAAQQPVSSVQEAIRRLNQRASLGSSSEKADTAGSETGSAHSSQTGRIGREVAQKQALIGDKVLHLIPTTSPASSLTQKPKITAPKPQRPAAAGPNRSGLYRVVQQANSRPKSQESGSLVSDQSRPPRPHHTGFQNLPDTPQTQTEEELYDEVDEIYEEI